MRLGLNSQSGSKRNHRKTRYGDLIRCKRRESIGILVQIVRWTERQVLRNCSKVTKDLDRDKRKGQRKETGGTFI